MSRDNQELRQAVRRATRSSDRTARERLRAVEEALALHPDCPHLLVEKAILIQVQDELAGIPGLDEAERCLLAAYAHDDTFLGALEELAHFYDAVSPDPAKARMYSERYIALVTPVLRDLTAIRDGVD